MSSFDHKVVHDRMQSIFDRNQIPVSPKNVFPAICEFTNELFTNPLLKTHLLAIANEAKPHFVDLNNFKEVSADEIKNTRTSLLIHAKKLPYIGAYLQECNNLDDNCRPMTWELLFALDVVLKRAIRHVSIDRSENYVEIIKNYASLDNKGNIMEYIFAPSLHNAYIEIVALQRKQKNSLYYSVSQLALVNQFFNLKIRTATINEFVHNKQPGVAELLAADAQNFDLALEKHDANDATKLNFDTEEYKLHIHRVWHFIKSKLLNNIAEQSSISKVDEIFYYSFTEENDLQKGFLKLGSSSPFELVGNSALLLYLAAKKKNLSSHEAGELMPESDATAKQRADNALRVINSGVLKAYSKRKFISSKRAIITINYPIELITS
jgi:hypothetical protein